MTVLRENTVEFEGGFAVHFKWRQRDEAHVSGELIIDGECRAETALMRLDDSGYWFILYDSPNWFGTFQSKWLLNRPHTLRELITKAEALGSSRALAECSREVEAHLDTTLWLRK